MRVGIDSEDEILRLTSRPKLYITVYNIKLKDRNFSENLCVL